MKNILFIITILAFLSCYLTAEITAKAYCVIDVSSNTIVKSKDQQLKLSPASPIKLLTAMVVLDTIAPEKVLTVSAKATQTVPSKIDLQVGEQLTCKDLLTALLLKSANDVAIVLAEGTSGSVEQFADAMNKKAQTLGCKQSFFVNPNGLTDQRQYSCAYDLAVIAYNASTNYALIREILAMPQAVITTTQGRKIAVENGNKLIKNKPPVYGKTGFTDDSQNTFAGFAEVNGKRMIIAILGVDTREILWKEIKILLDIAPVAPTTPAKNDILKNTPVNIQTILQKGGYYTGKIDGKIGPQSLEAIKKFQQDFGLKVDGKVGPQTWAKLVEFSQGKAKKVEQKPTENTKEPKSEPSKNTTEPKNETK